VVARLLPRGLRLLGLRLLRLRLVGLRLVGLLRLLPRGAGLRSGLGSGRRSGLRGGLRGGRNRSAPLRRGRRLHGAGRLLGLARLRAAALGGGVRGARVGLVLVHGSYLAPWGSYQTVLRLDVFCEAFVGI